MYVAAATTLKIHTIIHKCSENKIPLKLQLNPNGSVANDSQKI